MEKTNYEIEPDGTLRQIFNFNEVNLDAVNSIYLFANLDK